MNMEPAADRRPSRQPNTLRPAALGLVLLALALSALSLAGAALAARDLTTTLSAPSTVVDNSTFEVNLTAYNSGSGAGSSVQMQLFVDGNASGPVQDVGNLANGENRSAYENLTLACGVHQLNVTVDPSDGVPETNESNNNASLTLLVLPIANFTYDITGTLGNFTVVFDATSSHGCAPLNYTWNLGGLPRYGAVVNITPTAGNFTAVLVVNSATDPLLLNSAQQTLTIPNAAPSLSISVPATTIATLTPLALAIEADDPDGSVNAYLIDFGDGNGSSSLVDAATYRYHASGTFTVTVRVEDNLGASNQSTLTVNVTNRAPEADTTFAFWVTTPGTPVTFNASRSVDPEGGPLTIVWQFGDGGNATGPIVDHAYAAPGTYQVNVTVTDSGGASRSAQVTVRVEPGPSNGWLLPVIGGLIAALALFLLFFLFLRRRGKDDTSDAPKAGGPPQGEGSSPKPPSP